MSVYFIAFFLLVGCFFLILKSRWFWSLPHARRKGFYPDGREPTMFDVRRCLLEGEKDMAVKLYCKIFRVNSAQGTLAVEELEKGIRARKDDQSSS